MTSAQMASAPCEIQFLVSRFLSEVRSHVRARHHPRPGSALIVTPPIVTVQGATELKRRSAAAPLRMVSGQACECDHPIRHVAVDAFCGGMIVGHLRSNVLDHAMG